MGGVGAGLCVARGASSGGDGGAAANAEYAKKVGAPLDLAKQQLSKAGSRLLCMDKYVGVSDVKANDRELKSWRSRVKAAATGKQMAKVALEWLEWTAGSHHIQKHVEESGLGVTPSRNAQQSTAL